MHCHCVVIYQWNVFIKTFNWTLQYHLRDGAGKIKLIKRKEKKWNWKYPPYVLCVGLSRPLIVMWLMVMMLMTQTMSSNVAVAKRSGTLISAWFVGSTKKKREEKKKFKQFVLHTFQQVKKCFAPGRYECLKHILIHCSFSFFGIMRIFFSLIIISLSQL